MSKQRHMEKWEQELEWEILLALLDVDEVREQARRASRGRYAYVPGRLTQEEMAAWLGVHVNTIADWEREAILKLRGALRREGSLEKCTEIYNEIIEKNG